METCWYYIWGLCYFGPWTWRKTFADVFLVFVRDISMINYDLLRLSALECGKRRLFAELSHFCWYSVRIFNLFVLHMVLLHVPCLLKLLHWLPENCDLYVIMCEAARCRTTGFRHCLQFRDPDWTHAGAMGWVSMGLGGCKVHQSSTE